MFDKIKASDKGSDKIKKDKIKERKEIVTLFSLFFYFTLKFKCYGSNELVIHYQ